MRAALLLAAVAAGVLLFGSASAAHALNTAAWSAPTPAANAAVLIKPSWLSVKADDNSPIFAATMTINGLPAAVSIDRPIGHFVYDEEQESHVWVADDLTVAKLMTYNPGNRLVPGINTVVATVKSGSGVSTYSWTFNFGSATVVSVVSPAAGAVLPVSPLSISARLTSPSTSFTSTMKLDGAVVAATYTAGTKTFTHTPAALSPGTHTVVFTARDSSGGTVSKTWSFKVQPPMSTGGECATCHATYPAAHPVSGCSSCHDHGYTVPGGSHGNQTPTPAGCTGDGTQQASACHRLDHTSDSQWGIWGSGPFTCASCHSASNPKVPRHTDASITAVHTSTSISCGPCHTANLVTEHAKYPTAATIKFQCDLCHGPSARPQVKAAIVAGETGCEACHTGAGHASSHEAPVIAGCAGTGCHEGSNLTVVHNTVGCAACHSSVDATVISAIANGDRACDSCHGDSVDVHGTVHDGNPGYSARVTGEVSYNAPADGQKHGPARSLACVSCHKSSNLVTVHLGENSCGICHGSGGPRATFTAWDKTCQQGGCHTPTKFGNGWDAGVPYIQHNDAAAYTAHNAVTVQGRDASGCITTCHTAGCLSSCHTVKDGSSDISAPLTRVEQVGSDPITWKLYPADSQSGVAETYYSFDGAPFGLYGATDAAQGIRGALDVLRVGAHTLRCYSVDASGNAEAIKTTNYVTVGVDTTPPIITSTGVRNGSSVVATSFALSVLDPQTPAPSSGAVSLRVEYKTYVRMWEYYALPTPIWQAVTYSIPLTSWDATATFTGLENKAWAGFGGNTVANKNGYLFVVRYSATDNAGNSSAVVEDTVLIDNAAPTTSIATVTAGEYRWKLNSYDMLAGVASTRYSFDGGPFVAYTSADASSGIVNTQPGGSTQGSHTLRYYSADALGHVENTKTHTYSVVETTPPMASLSATMTSSSVVISAWDPEGPLLRSGVKSIVGSVVGSVSKSITTNFAPGDPAAVRSIEVTVPSDGSWTLYYTVYDWDGNQQWYSQSFRRDTTPPVSTLAGSWNTQWLLSGYDGIGVGVEASYYSFDGAPYTQAVYSPSWSTFTTPPQLMTKYGTHTLSYYSVDKFGFAETPKSTTFVVPDTTKPTIALVKSGGTWSKSAYLSAQDAVTVSSGVKEIRYRLNDGTWVVTPFNTSGNPTATVQADIANLPNGVVKVDYYVIDVAGNASTTVTTYIQIDNAAPTVSVTHQSTNADGSIVVRIAATESGTGSGVDRCWYEYTDGRGVQGNGVITGTTVRTITLPAPVSGSADASVSAYARDWMGNEGAPVVLTVPMAAPLDLLAPVTTAGVAEGSRFSSSDGVVVFGVFPGDNMSGVATTYYKIDGGEWQTAAYSPQTPVTVTGFGAHTFSFYSVDNAGNIEDTQVRSFEIIELATLSFNMTNVVYANANWKSFNYAYDVELYDESGGLEDVWSGQTWNGGNPAETVIKLPAYDAPQPWRVVLTLHTLGGSSLEYTWYDVVADAGERVDLSGTYSESWVGVEAETPTTMSNALPYYSVSSGQATTISLTPSDAGGSGLAATYYELDAAAQAQGTEISVAAPVAGSEEHTLRFWSVDNAGNIEAVQTVTFTVEVPAP